MTDQIRAPWTPEQVDALNDFQQRGGMHPFTCGNEFHSVHHVLVAAEDGWSCPDDGCDYRQDWAHAFMADPDAWPKSPIRSYPDERREQAETGLGRVTALYEQWVKAGPPPLGTSMARWWDKRLAELHQAIHPPTSSSPIVDRPFCSHRTTKEQP